MTREVKQILILDIAVASYVRARSPDPYMEESHGATPAKGKEEPLGRRKTSDPATAGFGYTREASPPGHCVRGEYSSIKAFKFLLKIGRAWSRLAYSRARRRRSPSSYASGRSVMYASVW